MSTVGRPTLERTGPPEARIGMISLPLPKESGSRLRIDHAHAGAVPVGWWRRHDVPRRVVAYVMDEAGVPETLRLTDGTPSASAPSKAWTVQSRVTVERLEFKAVKYNDVASLRGVPAEDCTSVESELLLGFGGQTLRFQAGATGPGGSGAYYWQNVQIDQLWENQVAQGVRVGGVIYNSDTYLWADVYLVLFANGVADVAVHFVNTKLHIDGYDFRGLPFIRFAGDLVEPTEVSIPADGCRFALGGLNLNLGDAEILTSDQYPGRIEPGEDGVIWRPFSRTFNPQVADAPEDEWAIGFARTVRFQLSLSEAPPLIARYRAPSWWYALCGEPWPWGYLPVHGRYDRLSELTADYIRGLMVRGRFDAGSADHSNDGDAGVGMMESYYHTGRPEVFKDALDYCYYWADLSVDHRDFTVRQWAGGSPWKTCAYSKFRDVIFGYLETGDPYLLDVAEMCAESYWQWFRANWPRCTIGRDAFEVGAWALMWRFFDTEHARERCVEFVRMIRTVLQSRGTIGGQIGAGPHPGYHSSLYMTGVCMISLLDVAEAQAEKRFDKRFDWRFDWLTAPSEAEGAAQPIINDIPELLHCLSAHYMREDIEVFPSNFGCAGPWSAGQHSVWIAMGCRIYPELARLSDPQQETTQAGMRRCVEKAIMPLEEWGKPKRVGGYLISPIYHDALVLGARWTGEGVRLEPVGTPDLCPPEQVVFTPLGDLKVTVEQRGQTLLFRFDADAEFPVEVSYGGVLGRSSSRQTLEVER